MRYINAHTSILLNKMKSVLQTLQNEPCRVHELCDNELNTFSNYTHLQRYHPAIDLFKSPDSVFSHKHLELPSKYNIDSWVISI